MHDKNLRDRLYDKSITTDYTSTAELESKLAAEKKFLSECLESPLESLTKQLTEDIRVRFTGKSSPLQEYLKSLKKLEPQERKPAGALINNAKTHIEERVTEFLKKFQDFEERHRLEKEKVDLSLPFPKRLTGSRHPVQIVMRDLSVPFLKMGFAIIDGPEIEHNFYNFDALNIKPDHPAREMQDTFFLSSEWVLRTHTSNSQIHSLFERKLPLKVICPGTVYRKEHDLTHAPSFRQMECLVVDKGIHMGHLRYVISEFLSAAFGRPVKTRLRASYFPFTEPSAEVDVECQQCFGAGCRSCKMTGWSEIGGCGVVNKRVLENCGIDANEYSGIAFGFGIERIAMSRFAIPDLRSLYDGYLPFLESFGLK